MSLTEKEKLELRKEVARLNLNQYRLFKSVGADVDDNEIEEVREHYEECLNAVKNYENNGTE